MTEQQMIINLVTGIFVGALPVAGYFAYKYFKKKREDEQKKFEAEIDAHVERENKALDRAFKYSKGWYNSQRCSSVKTGQDFLRENEVIIEEIIGEDHKPLQVWTAPERFNASAKKKRRRFSDMSAGEKAILLLAGFAAAFVVYNMIKKRR